MPQMTLAKALVYKKRVEKEIMRLKEKMTRSMYISSLNEEPTEADKKAFIDESNESYNKWMQAKQHLTDLKVLLFNASAPIRKSIFWLAELKDQAVASSGLQAARNEKGMVTSSIGYEKTRTYTMYATFIDKRDENVKDIQKKIDVLQGEIEAFNHKTMIDIPDFTL